MATAASPSSKFSKSTLRTREYIEKGEGEGKTLLDAMRDGDTEGMQHFDGEIEKLIRSRTIDFETGFTYATNPGNLRLELSRLPRRPDKPKPRRQGRIRTRTHSIAKPL